jgi:hypothetical protein
MLKVIKFNLNLNVIVIKYWIKIATITETKISMNKLIIYWIQVVLIRMCSKVKDLTPMGIIGMNSSLMIKTIMDKIV